MLLLMIRHGLTPRTGVKLSGWTPGVDLSKEGRAQAETLAQRLSDVKLDAIYSSPLERCWQTAEPVAKAKGLDVVRRDELGEVRYGALEGKSLKTLAKSKVWVHLRAWPSDVRFPGGESIRETQARAVAAVEHLREEHARDVVAVFSHGDWIRLAMAHYLGVHIDLYRRLAVDPVSVSALQFYDMGVVARSLNETGTLATLTPPRQPKPKPAKRATGVAK